MIVTRIEDYKGGWFTGNFDPAILKQQGCEVGYKLYRAGEKWDVHYHLKAVEVTFLLRGEMTIQGRLLKSGDVLRLDPMEIADPVFHTDCEVVIVKSPSVPGDKYEVSK